MKILDTACRSTNKARRIQLAFVALVVAAVAVLEKLAGHRAAMRVSRAVTYCSGLIAALWFFERTVAVFS